MTQESKKNSIPRSATSSSFKRLEDGIRQLRRLLVGMVVLIAILPTALYFYISLSSLHERAEVYASQMGFLIGTHLERSDPMFANLSSRLWEVMKNDRVLFLQLLGTESQEIVRIGEPKHQMFVMTAEVRSFPPEHRVKSVVIQHDVRPLILKAGRVFGVHLVVASMLILIVYVIPIRALRQAVDHVKIAHAQIIHSDKLSAIGEVYASLTHEINNPLSILLSRVKLLISSAQEQQFPPELVRDLEVIERHGTRIANIIRGLLTFARKTPFEFIEIDLNQVINGAIALVEKPFAKEGIRIETALVPESLTFLGSHNHLLQVFLNLLNNARDAMPQEGRIRIRTFRKRTYLGAEIQDNGIGIAPDVLDKIFEPFFTTKEVGKGTGLGLSVSYGIIIDHNGEIEVESTPGEGTIFRMIFPQEEVRR